MRGKLREPQVSNAGERRPPLPPRPDHPFISASPNYRATGTKEEGGGARLFCEAVTTFGVTMRGFTKGFTRFPGRARLAFPADEEALEMLRIVSEAEQCCACHCETSAT
jgi:hypothetical protein